MRYDCVCSDTARRQTRGTTRHGRPAAPAGARAPARRSSFGALRSCLRRSCPRTARAIGAATRRRARPPAPSSATPSSARCRRASDQSTFITEPSISGRPPLRDRVLHPALHVLQDLLHVYACASRWRTIGSRSRPSSRASAASAAYPSAAALPPPITAASCASTARAGAQPSSISPTTFVDRNAHVGEEHLVEVRGAGDLTQRAHLDTRRAQIERERT